MIVFDLIILIILLIIALVMCADKIRHSAWITVYIGLALALLGVYQLVKSPQAALFLQEYILPVAGLAGSIFLSMWLIKINAKDKKQL